MTAVHAATTLPTVPSGNPMTLEGRVIVVTGAAQGIGRAIAERAVSLGARVALVDLQDEALKAVEAALGDRAKAYVGSVADPSFVAAAVADAETHFGGLHGLVNNAGITRTALIEKMTLDEWNAVISVHLTGAFLFTQAVGRTMIARVKAGDPVAGAIVNVSSDAGVQGTFGQINYGAAKAGLIRFSSALGLGCVVPGWIRTERAVETLAAMPAAEREAARLVEPEAVAQAVVDLIRDPGRVIVLP